MTAIAKQSAFVLTVLRKAVTAAEQLDMFKSLLAKVLGREYVDRDPAELCVQTSLRLLRARKQSSTNVSYMTTRILLQMQIVYL